MVRFGCLAFAAALLAQHAWPQNYRAPLGPDGHPDLQGVWSANWLTTLERPQAFNSLVVTEEQETAWLPGMLTARANAELYEATVAYPSARSLAIVGGERRTSFILDPPDGKMPITEAGRARMTRNVPTNRPTDNPEDRTPNERCLAGHGRAGTLIAPLGNMQLIVQSPDHVVIWMENFSDLRLLPTDGRMRGGGMASWHGVRAARWEGESLIIETTGFRPDDQARSLPMSRFPISPQTKISERYTRVSEEELLYQFSVEDAELYTQKWSAEYSLRRADILLLESACHEGNYALANILRGARVIEQRGGAR
jgi:hypothetical protein